MVKSFLCNWFKYLWSMGEELIPLQKEDETKKFMTDHFGKKSF